MQISFVFAGSQVQISWQSLTKLVWTKAPGSTTVPCRVQKKEVGVSKVG